MSDPTFNLSIDPWIPVRDAAGTRHLLSLESLFQQAGNLADLELRPHERIAASRFLVCITQRVLGAPEEGEWDEFAVGFEEKISAYLEEHRAAFELFGDGPRFLQMRPDKIGEPVPVSKLLPNLATGNNPTPFDHGGGMHRPLPCATLALALLTFQNFYPLYGAGYKGRGPCVDGNMLHTLMRGVNLRETILRNCLDLNILDHPILGGMGCPIWEKFPVSPADKPAVENATLTYLGRLVPLHRSVWLTDDRAGFLLSQQGWEYPRFPQYREPTATVVNDAKKNADRLLWASLHRAVWRELHTLTVMHRGTHQASQAGGPFVLQTRGLTGLNDGKMSLWTGALVTDLKAKILDTVESSFLVPARMFTEQGRFLYGEGVNYAKSRSDNLYHAVKKYGKVMKLNTPPTDRATRHYWNLIDQQSTLLLQIVGDPRQANVIFGRGSPVDAWTSAVRTALRDAYDTVCPRMNPRQICAYAEGLLALYPAHAKPKSDKPRKVSPVAAMS